VNHIVIYNKDLVAMPSRVAAPVGIPVDPYECYGTPYGMFIPLSSSANQFVRWMKKGMKDKLPKKSVMAYMLHISNDGEVILVTVDTEADLIIMTRYVSNTFSVLTGTRDTANAYSDLISDCTNIADAVRIVDESDPAGLFEPIIFFVQEWVEYAKKQGYTDTFYWTYMSEIYETFGK
jgi:hypothetical protein